MNLTTNSQIAILITTRYFNTSHLAGCDEIERKMLSSKFDEVIELRLWNLINEDDRQNVYKNKHLDVEDGICNYFFTGLQNYTSTPINYDEKLRQMKGSNIYFYHHYPDRQLGKKGTETNLPSVPYIAGLINEILQITTDVDKIILVLHKGDLLGVELGSKDDDSKPNSFYQQILKEVKEQSTIYNRTKDVVISKIYTFSHDASSDPIWRYCLNKPDFFKNIEGSKEKYLAEWLDPEKANEYFNIFKYTTI